MIRMQFYVMLNMLLKLHMFFVDVFLHGGGTGESMVQVHALDPDLSSAEGTHGFSLHVFHVDV